MHSEITLLSLLCCNGHLCEAQNKRMASVDRQRAGAGKRSGNWRAELSRRANACANRSRRQASQGKHQSGAPQAFLNGTPFKFKCYGPLNDLKRFVQRMPIWPMSARRCYSCALVAAARSHTRAIARLHSTARQLPERLPAPARCPSTDTILLFCASQGWSLQQSNLNWLCKPEHLASRSQLLKVRAARSLRAPLRCLTMCLCVLCPPPPLPARAVASAACLARISLRARRACARSRATSLLPACCFPSCALLHPCSPWLTFVFFGAQIYSSGAAYPFPPPSSPPPPCPPPSPPLPPPEPP